MGNSFEDEKKDIIRCKSDILHSTSCKSCLLSFSESSLTILNGENYYIHVISEEDVPNLQIVRCSNCHKSKGIIKENEKIVLTIEDALRDSTQGRNGWKKVETTDERRILYILSQIVYNEEEKTEDIKFSYPPRCDLSKICWINDEAVGFYTVKLKGTFNCETMSLYSMTTLDTIFIRSKKRRKGLGLSSLYDIKEEFPDQNIRFSYPLTSSMRQVCWKYLKKSKEDRLHFWESMDQFFGDVGNIRNLWFTLKRQYQNILSNV